MRVLLITALFCVTLIGRGTSAQNMTDATNQLSPLVREAWIGAQMRVIRADPRLYYEYLDAFVEHESSQIMPGLFPRRTEPRISDYTNYASRRFWSLLDSPELDLILSGGKFGKGSRASTRLEVAQNVRELLRTGHKIKEKWEKDVAATAFKNVRHPETLLGSIFDYARRDAGYASGKTPVTMFTARVVTAAKDYASVPVDASNLEILEAGGVGVLVPKLIEALRSADQGQRERLSQSKAELKKFIEDRVGRIDELQSEFIRSARESFTNFAEEIGELSKALSDEREKAARRHEVQRIRDEASGLIRIGSSVLYFLDEGAGEKFQTTGFALVNIGSSLADMADKGFTASALGDFGTGVVAIAMLMAGPKSDPFADFVAEQFRALQLQLRQIYDALKVIDERILSLAEMQNINSAALMGAINTLRNEVQGNGKLYLDTERARAWSEFSKSFLGCKNLYENDLMSPDDSGRRAFFGCLDAFFSFATQKSMEPPQVKEAFNAILPSSSSSVLANFIDYVFEPEYYASASEEAVSYLISKDWADNEGANFKKSLREFSPAFAAMNRSGLEAFNPRLWLAGLRASVDLQIAAPLIVPSLTSPSSEYFQIMSDMGEWKWSRLSWLTSEGAIRRGLVEHQYKALFLAAALQDVIKYELEKKYPSFVTQKKTEGPFAGYFDVPLNIFMGFGIDDEWRTGFDLSDPKHAIFLANLLGLTEARVANPVNLTGGGRVTAGFRQCWSVTITFVEKGTPSTVPYGEAEVHSCSTATDGGMNGALSIAGTDKRATRVANFYAKNMYLFHSERYAPNAWSSFHLKKIGDNALHREMFFAGEGAEARWEGLRRRLREKVRETTKEMLQIHFGAKGANSQEDRREFRKHFIEPLDHSGVALALAIGAKSGPCALRSKPFERLIGSLIGHAPGQELFDGQLNVDKDWLDSRVLYWGANYQKVLPKWQRELGTTRSLASLIPPSHGDWNFRGLPTSLYEMVYSRSPGFYGVAFSYEEAMIGAKKETSMGVPLCERNAFSSLRLGFEALDNWNAWASGIRAAAVGTAR